MSKVGHILFALGLLLSWANSALHIALADRPIYAGSIRMFRGSVGRTRLALVLGASVAYVALVVSFVAGTHPRASAAAIVAALAVIRRFEIAQWHDDIVVRLGKYVPAAACLLAWLSTDIALEALGTPEAERLAWNAACGVLAGAHVLAGIAKVRESGPSWMQAHHQALLIAERAFAGPAWMRSLRLAVARSPRASHVVGIVGLVAEFAAILLVVPAARPFVVTAMLVLYLGFMLLLGYFEIEWMAVILAVALLAAA
jgi:hypothetical protein